MTTTDRSEDPDTPSGADGAIRAEYDWTATTPTTAVIETVAIASNRKPTGIEPLYEVIDPDALDALVRSSGAESGDDGTAVTFEFAGQCVTVRGGGAVMVRPVEPGLGDA
jgi:hypothetical protein